MVVWQLHQCRCFTWCHHHESINIVVNRGCMWCLSAADHCIRYWCGCEECVESSVVTRALHSYSSGHWLCCAVHPAAASIPCTIHGDCTRHKLVTGYHDVGWSWPRWSSRGKHAVQFTLMPMQQFPASQSSSSSYICKLPFCHSNSSSSSYVCQQV